jgi:signal transduction histidine kinase
LSFRISARTILHLGSELISSDGVAFYELIKNALDAQSPEVRIDVVNRLAFDTYDAILRELGARSDDAFLTATGEQPIVPRRRPWKVLRRLALANVIADAPGLDELVVELEAAANRSAFIVAIRGANFIDVDDDGSGMSLRTLREVFLTIGTSNRGRQRARLRERREAQIAAGEDVDPRRLILGEKGLGRLSTMRLGDAVEVVTGQIGTTRWNLLDIDWNDFANNSDSELQSVQVAPRVGHGKERDQQGTLIKVSGLRSAWSKETLERMAVEEFSKLVDPLDEHSVLPIVLRFNGDVVDIPTFAEFIQENAHGVFEASFALDGNGQPQVTGSMDYRMRGRRRPLAWSAIDLLGDQHTSLETLARVGPFDLKVYWFNRRLLTKIEGIGNLVEVRRLLSKWAGGVSLYRDGFRVNPYGGPSDDWLDLDRNAFSTSGFKLNRGQIVGRCRISQEGNPYLVDQTNREGLKNGPEKAAFVGILSDLMEYFRNYVVAVDAELDRARNPTARDALARFDEEDTKLAELVPELIDEMPTTREGRALSRRLTTSAADLRAAAAGVRQAAAQQSEERGRVMHLASIGLMIEILAHELHRSTSSGLSAISQARRSSDPASTRRSLTVLDAELRTLQKRLKVLDPLSTNARQTKEEFELVGWVRDIVTVFAQQRARSRIAFRVVVHPAGASRRISAVKGMFVQVIENLLVNSTYWIEQQARVDTGLRTDRRAEDDDEPIGSVIVTIRPEDGIVLITDDGPGIPDDRRDLVFQPFFTTRKQKQGKGLGLYISREIAEYHGGSLIMGEPGEDGFVNTMIFDTGVGEDD